jgi:hypothetical protein
MKESKLSHQNNQNGNGPNWILYGLGALLVLLPFILLIPFNFPGSDDYSDFQFVREYGLATAISKYYTGWGGRFFSVSLVYLLNTVGANNFLPYRLLNLVSLLMLTALCYQLALIYRRITGSVNDILPVFLIILVIVLGYLPGPVELIYWFTGSWFYLPGLLLIAGWVLLVSEKKQPEKWRLALVLVLPFLIAGTNELNIILFGGTWLLTFLTIHPLRKYLLMAALIFLSGAGMALLTPGNSLRQDFFLQQAGNHAGEIIFSVRQAIKAIWHYGRDWPRSTPLLIAGLLLYQFSGGQKTVHPGDKKNSFLLLISLLTIILVTIPFYWGTGRMDVALRVRNISWIAFSFFFLCLMVMLMKRFEGKAAKQPVITVALFVILLSALTYRSNWRNALNDLHIAENYKEQMNERINQAVNAQRTDTLNFLPLKFKPATIVYIDLNKDPGHWFNRGFAYRYDVAAVKILPDSVKQ